MQQTEQYPRLKRLAKWACYGLVAIVFIWIFAVNFERLDEERENSIIDYEATHNFDDYCKAFKKSYPDPAIYERRKEAYVTNYRNHFRQAGTATMRINKFADWFDEEWDNIMSLRTSTPDDAEAHIYSQQEYDQMNSEIEGLVPIDWRERGVIGPLIDHTANVTFKGK